MLLLLQRFSEPCRHLVAQLLQPDPEARFTAAQVLAHPWVSKGMPCELASLNDRLLTVRL